VVIQNGAKVTFKAPNIVVKSGFQAQEGAQVNFMQQQ
jgi:hypothetical protein